MRKKKVKDPFEKILKNKEWLDYHKDIQKLYGTILTNQTIMGANNIFISTPPESHDAKITRLKKEIEERQKELHSLEFKDKINGVIND